MTLQVAFLIFIPLLLAIDVYAIVIGRRGSTKTHKITCGIGFAALILLAIFAVALVDLLTQVWVMRPGSVSGAVYVVSGVGFIVLSLGALVMSQKLRTPLRDS